jgi:hypothetical protein
VRFSKAVATSTGPAEILTDQGRCFLKALGNKEGPHVLAAEWVGTALADWFGLRTFALARLIIQPDDDIPLGHGKRAMPGPAIALRAESGATWGGSASELRATANVEAISRLVVFDTWLLNCDRHPPDLSVRKPNYDNVFLSAQAAPAGKFHLTAMDHTHCFSCGRELNDKLGHIDRIKDVRLYGAFPAFGEFIDRAAVEASIEQLGRMDRSQAAAFVEEIAPEWEVSKSAREALVSFICERADFVGGTMLKLLFN